MTGGAELVERGPYTFCPNAFECPAQLAGRLEHFGSRDALDIEGLGEETARLFVREDVVESLPELFDLTVDEVEALDTRAGMALGVGTAGLGALWLIFGPIFVTSVEPIPGKGFGASVEPVQPTASRSNPERAGLVLI